MPLTTLSKVCGSKSQSVYPVGDNSPGDSTDELDGVLEFARKGEATAERFGEFCRVNLCMESWDFIVEVVHYETVSPMLFFIVDSLAGYAGSPVPSLVVLVLGWYFAVKIFSMYRHDKYTVFRGYRARPDRGWRGRGALFVALGRYKVK